MTSNWIRVTRGKTNCITLTMSVPAASLASFSFSALEGSFKALRMSVQAAGVGERAGAVGQSQPRNAKNFYGLTFSSISIESENVFVHDDGV